MTAIAYDGKFLAADRAATSNDVRTAVNKLSYYNGHKGEFLAALCGNATWILQVEEYFNSDVPVEFPDVLKYNEGGDKMCFGVLISVWDGQTFALSGCGRMLPEYSKMLTAGYCYSFLHGVLATGATATTAIALSQIYSDGSGMGVTTIDIEEFRKRKRDERSKSLLLQMTEYMDPLEVAAHVNAIRPVE